MPRQNGWHGTCMHGGMGALLSQTMPSRCARHAMPCHAMPCRAMPRHAACHAGPRPARMRTPRACCPCPPLCPRCVQPSRRWTAAPSARTLGRGPAAAAASRACCRRVRFAPGMAHACMGHGMGGAMDGPRPAPCMCQRCMAWGQAPAVAGALGLAPLLLSQCLLLRITHRAPCRRAMCGRRRAWRSAWCTAPCRRRATAWLWAATSPLRRCAPGATFLHLAAGV